ncbi:hypothetical protein PanWU01x14_124970, partial [Parasponia andersonii]
MAKRKMWRFWLKFKHCGAQGSGGFSRTLSVAALHRQCHSAALFSVQCHGTAKTGCSTTVYHVFWHFLARFDLAAKG